MEYPSVHRCGSLALSGVWVEFLGVLLFLFIPYDFKIVYMALWDKNSIGPFLF